MSKQEIIEALVQIRKGILTSPAHAGPDLKAIINAIEANLVDKTEVEQLQANYDRATEDLQRQVLAKNALQLQNQRNEELASALLHALNLSVNK
jgi:hypothetical protein